ncbi:MAG: YdcF family protein [Hasllibacter sp.]
MAVVLVPGCRVLPDGRPSPALARRIAEAVRRVRTGEAEALIGTGGAGADHPPEGAAIAAEAVRLGLPPAAVLAETRSTTTWENVALALPLIAGREVLIATERWHLPRALMIARRHGLTARGAPCRPGPWPQRLRGGAREAPAFVKDLLRPLTPR